MRSLQIVPEWSLKGLKYPWWQIYTHESLCANTHTHTHGTECVWINVPREMLSFSWRRLSQHTHVTSLSGHFILLFKLFQTPPLRRLWRFAQQKDSSTAVSLVYSTVSRNPLRQAELCQWQKKEDRAKRSFCCCFSTRRSLDVLFLNYCHFSLKRNVWICGKDSMLLLLSLQERENKYELQFVSLCYVDQTLIEFCTQTQEWICFLLNLRPCIFA